MTTLLKRLIKAAAALIAFAPRRARHLIGDALGIIWFDVFRIRRRVALDNLTIAFPDMSERDRIRIARRSLMHMGRSILDFTIFPWFDDDWAKREFVVQGWEHLDRAIAKDKGALFLSLHLGNGDLAVAAYSRFGLKINLISKFFRSKWLNEAWFGMRARHGTRFIPPEKSSFEILRALKRKEAVVFVLDQFMGPPVGVRTRFFGRETGTAAGLALMAERTGAPVIPAYTYRLPDGRSQMVFEAEMSSLASDLRPLDRDENIAMLTQSYADKLEGIIRQHPEQWMWVHRRWKEFGNEGRD